jgi:hypothetical protein
MFLAQPSAISPTRMGCGCLVVLSKAAPSYAKPGKAQGQWHELSFSLVDVWEKWGKVSKETERKRRPTPGQ